MVEVLGKGESPFSNFDYFYQNGYKGILIEEDNPSPKAKNHWVIKENIRAILKTYQCPHLFDALSIDLNGNDYWVLDELLTEFRPRLIIAEFNSSKDGAVTIKYDSNFRWKEDDYYGFSFGAGKKLAEKHGYYIIFQNDELNLYMVAKEFVEPEGIPECTYEKRISFAHNPRGEWVNL